ncbi:MAG: hypothetical protein ACFB5Z_00440 [Elainellaceae cyanobacterium]
MTKKRLFSGMGYREVQRSNSHRRSHLPKDNQKLLKRNGYRNVGWENVISLYQKINSLLEQTSDEPSLEELFLEADRIGEKYQSAEEVQQFEQKMLKEIEQISSLVDQQFPDEEAEFVDFGQRR